MSNKTEVLSAKKGFLKPSTRENLRIYWYNFRSNKLSMVGLTIVLISVVLAVFAPYIAPFFRARRRLRRSVQRQPGAQRYVLVRHGCGRT